MSIFLSKEDIKKLTGKTQKSCQIDMLRAMGIQFYINASDRPVVPISAIEGLKQNIEPDQSWEPAVLKENAQKTT